MGGTRRSDDCVTFALSHSDVSVFEQKRAPCIHSLPRQTQKAQCEAKRISALTYIRLCLRPLIKTSIIIDDLKQQYKTFHWGWKGGRLSKHNSSIESIVFIQSQINSKLKLITQLLPRKWKLQHAMEKSNKSGGWQTVGCILLPARESVQ